MALITDSNEHVFGRAMPSRSSLKRMGWCAGILALILSGACKSRESEADVKVIGGFVAEPGQFPGVALERNSCTVAKIAPHYFLQAGHCVAQYGEISPRYSGGPFSVIGLTTDVVVNSEKQSQRVHVKATYMFPSYQEMIYGKFNDSNLSNKDLQRPDVAVMEIVEDTPQIPITEYSAEPLTESDHLIALGYGCEKAPRGNKSSSYPRRLKWFHTQLDKTKKSEVYWYTPAGKGEGDDALLCPGDSGGPLLLDRNGVLSVVGVNSRSPYNVPTEKAGPHLHTRIDRNSAERVDLWLDAVLAGKATPAPLGPLGRYIQTAIPFELMDGHYSDERVVENPVNRWVFPTPDKCLRIRLTSQETASLTIAELSEEGQGAIITVPIDSVTTWEKQEYFFSGYFGIALSQPAGGALGKVTLKVDAVPDNECDLGEAR